MIISRRRINWSIESFMFQLPCQIDDSFPSLLLSPTNCGNQFRIQRYYIEQQRYLFLKYPVHF